jgi:hypothetical protein
MGHRTLSSLRSCLDFRLSELLGFDLVFGLIGAGGGTYLALQHAEGLAAPVAAAAGLVGVVLGAVVAATAIVTAFMDQGFLRRLALLPAGRNEPSYYLAPFLFTGVLGVAGGLSLLVLISLTPTSHAWARGVVGAGSGFFTVYTIASLMPALDAIVQLTSLRHEAAQVSDDAVERLRTRRTS